VANYVKLVLLLSRVEDRKVVIGLYSYAHDVQNQFTETGFAHLSEFISNFNEPIKRLSDEFSRNHIRTLEEALKSLLHPYQV